MTAEERERAAFAALVMPLAQAMRVDIDKATWAAYHRALKDVPHGLLAEAIERLIREPRPFFPKAGELRAECERQRQLWLAARPWEPCEACATSPRFVEVIVDGVPRLTRCSCWLEHQRLIEVAGMGMPLALPPAREEVTS